MPFIFLMSQSFALTLVAFAHVPKISAKGNLCPYRKSLPLVCGCSIVMCMFGRFSRIFVILVALVAMIGLGNRVLAQKNGASLFQKNQTEIDMVGHNAIYDLKLTAVKRGAKILDVAGQMDFDLVQVCDGWKSQHGFDLRYDYIDGPARHVESIFSLFESAQRPEFAFHSIRFIDGQLAEDYSGQVGMQNERLQGEIIDNAQQMKLPLTLSGDMIFPQAHMKKLLTTARTGKKIVTARVFDGTVKDKAFYVTGLITPVKDQRISRDRPHEDVMSVAHEAVSHSAIDASLLQGRKWSVRLAFFPSEEGVQAETTFPDYEMTVLLEDNGIISEMIVEYSDFTVTQTLRSLSRKPKEGCSPDGK